TVSSERRCEKSRRTSRCLKPVSATKQSLFRCRSTIAGLPRNASRPDLHYDLYSVPRNDGTHRSVIARRLHVVMGPGKGYRRRRNLFVDAVQQLRDCHGTLKDPTYTKIYVAFLARTSADAAIS